MAEPYSAEEIEFWRGTYEGIAAEMCGDETSLRWARQGVRLLAAIDVRDAEIKRLREQVKDIAANYIALKAEVGRL